MPSGRYKKKKNKEVVELNGTHQLLVYTDHDNLLDENTDVYKIMLQN
jgi:hypothetical protein